MCGYPDACAGGFGGDGEFMTLTLPRACVWAMSWELCIHLVCEQGLLQGGCLWETLCLLLVLSSLQAALCESSSALSAFARAVISLTSQLLVWMKASA